MWAFSAGTGFLPKVPLFFRTRLLNHPLVSLLGVLLAALVLTSCGGAEPTDQAPSQLVMNIPDDPASETVSMVEYEQLVSALEQLHALLLAEREARLSFEDVMVTNFDLLEQGVAQTLGSLMEESVRRPAAQTPVSSAPPVHPAPAAPVVPTTAATVQVPTVPQVVGATPGIVPPSPTLASTRAPQAFNDPDLTPPANPTALSANPAAKQAYDYGFRLFAQGDFTSAIVAYQEFLARFPADRYSDNATFWIGEAYMRLGNLTEAEEAYRSVLRNFAHRPTVEGYKTPEAIYRLGQLALQTGETAAAQYYFRALLERFPDSSIAERAAKDLQTLELDTVNQGQSGGLLPNQG